MNTPKITNRHLLEFANTCWQWRSLWVSTTAAFAGLALLYVLFVKGDTWVASQGIIVRDEANGAVTRLGRFESHTAMRAAQETVLEMARNSQVLSDALTATGREPSWFRWLENDAPPSNAEIEDLANNGIVVHAPRGAELGTTEVFYLDVKQSSRERALELATAVCDALENRLKQVRQARANGVISELSATKSAAESSLREATVRLQRTESEAGTDLSDLRALTDTLGGGSSTRQSLDIIKRELRQAELAAEAILVDLTMAKESFDDPEQLLLTPPKMVNNQPGLKRLREGLATASIASSQLQGRYRETHPLVLAARETEQKIREQLRLELGVSVETMNKEYEVSNSRIQKLKQQQASVEARINKLAQIRADYANTVSEVRARDAQLREAGRELAQAEASRDAAMTSSLITRLDEPLIGENPIGPGRSTILAAASMCGLFFGFGVVFLLSPLDGMNYGRRRFDYSGAAGRRAADADSAGTRSGPSEHKQSQKVDPRPLSESIETAKTTGTDPHAVVRTRAEQDSPLMAANKPGAPRKSVDSKKSLAAAQAVIAAALECSYSDDANASPKPRT